MQGVRSKFNSREFVGKCFNMSNPGLLTFLARFRVPICADKLKGKSSNPVSTYGLKRAEPFRVMVTKPKSSRLYHLRVLKFERIDPLKGIT